MQVQKNLPDYKQTLANKILDAAMKAFMAHGIRAVKMDDIAMSLSISKRTLYEIFSNKEELLLDCLRRQFELNQRQMTDYAASGCSVMDILLYSFKIRIRDLRQTNPLFYADIEKYPSLLAFFEHRHCDHRAQLLRFLRRGVEEGYFLDYLNYEFVSLMLDESNRMVMRTQLYKKYSMETVFLNQIFISIRGLCTQKGQRAFDRFYADYRAGMDN